MHVSLKEGGKEMHIREPGGGWFLRVSGFCILENQEVSCVKVINCTCIKVCVCAELFILIHHRLTPHMYNMEIDSLPLKFNGREIPTIYLSK